jgi:helix-turn-helix protein
VNANLPDVLTAGDLALFLRVPIGTVYTWRATGQGPRGYRVGKHLRYDRADVQTYIDIQKAGTP